MISAFFAIFIFLATFFARFFVAFFRLTAFCVLWWYWSKFLIWSITLDFIARCSTLGGQYTLTALIAQVTVHAIAQTQRAQIRYGRFTNELQKHITWIWESNAWTDSCFCWLKTSIHCFELPGTIHWFGIFARNAALLLRHTCVALVSIHVSLALAYTSSATRWTCSVRVFLEIFTGQFRTWVVTSGRYEVV